MDLVYKSLEMEINIKAFIVMDCFMDKVIFHVI